ncbi:hypothetical protein ABZV61_35870 [Streptomyces sp900116325]|uniref:MFS transporter n=1 Tax=Streptomyces sp. 900116325 TaxID=3154295 RepID=A0ABV2UJL5_9ACTN
MRDHGSVHIGVSGDAPHRRAVVAQVSTNITGPRFGPRVVVPAGMLLAATGLVWLTGIGAHTSYAAHVLPPLLVIGLGLGHVMPISFGAATAGVDAGDAGAASATVNTMQQVGCSIGTALLNTLATSAAAAYVEGHTPTKSLLAEAQLHSFTTAFWWSAGIFAFGAIATGLLFRGHGTATVDLQKHAETPAVA